MPVTLGSWDEQGLTLERESVPSGFDTHLSLVPLADKIETWHGAQVNKQTNKPCPWWGTAKNIRISVQTEWQRQRDWQTDK